jgi:hypothetical protein
VPDLTIQPTAKFLKAGAIFAVLIIVALEVVYLTIGSGAAAWWLALPFLVLH